MVRAGNLYLTELLGHGPTILASSITTLMAALFTGIMSQAANDIVSAASAGITAWPIAVEAAALLVLPSIFASIGVYALVKANADILKYEAGLLSSQGIASSTLTRVWMMVLATLPAVSYIVGIIAYVQSNTPRVSLSSFGTLLPMVLATGSLAVFSYLEIRSIIRSSPFATIRVP